MRDQTSTTETIFALSSGSLPSGVGVVRLTGPQSGPVLAQLCGTIPQPRVAQLCSLRDHEGNLIDRGLCLYFVGPASFTGEDSAEFQVHGGKAVVAKLLETLASMPGLRPAEAGEFTKRAYLNGKLDLANAEALSDLISAETEAQRRFAISNTTSKHRQLYDKWRKQLIHARGMIEAELDFSDEADVPGSVSDVIWADVQSLRMDIANHASSYRSAEIIRDGLQVVLLGAPNSGKSSLLNALARRDVAIVTDEAGTTRDVLEVHLDLGGLKVNLADTAGIRTAAGNIEAIGIRRSLQKASDADLVLHIEDMAAPTTFESFHSAPVLRVGNKMDLVQSPSNEKYDCEVSATTGEGLDRLTSLIARHGAEHIEQATSTIPFKERHKALLDEALTQIDHAVEEARLELAAERLRLASNALGKICGEIDVDDLLDTIFSSFCIGK